MTTIVEYVFSVFTAISDWLVETIQSFVPVFYSTETGMTFLGVMALCGLGVGIILLLFNIVKSFVQFR